MMFYTIKGAGIKMTEKKLSKYVGEYVSFEMQVFPHSIDRNKVEGRLRADEVENSYYRDGAYQRKKHLDFILISDFHHIVIPWNNVKLIVDSTFKVHGNPYGNDAGKKESE